jgi:hypothetical protein
LEKVNNYKKNGYKMFAEWTELDSKRYYEIPSNRKEKPRMPIKETSGLLIETRVYYALKAL